MTHNRSALIVGLMMIIILGPLFFAWGIIKKGDHQQLRLNHHGDLIASLPNISDTSFTTLPAQEPISGKTLSGKWWLVYVGSESGQATCEQTLVNMRQMHVALGKHASKLHRAFINDPHNAHGCEASLQQHTPQISVFNLATRDFHNLFTPVSNPLDREIHGELYLIDPQGNIMMRYSTQTRPQDILSDLKRLLRISKQG